MNTRDRQNLAKKIVAETMRAADGKHPSGAARSAALRDICARCAMGADDAAKEYDRWIEYFDDLSKEQAESASKSSETGDDKEPATAPAVAATQTLEDAERAGLMIELNRQIAESKSNLSAIASQIGELKALLDAAHDPPLSQAENDAIKQDHEKMSLELMSAQAKLSALMSRKCELLEAMLQK